jgi:hypothetical protein
MTGHPKVKGAILKAFGQKPIASKEKRILRELGQDRFSKKQSQAISHNPWVLDLPPQRLVFPQVPNHRSTLGGVLKDINGLACTPQSLEKLVRNGRLFRANGLYLKKAVINRLSSARSLDAEVARLLKWDGKSPKAAAAQKPQSRPRKGKTGSTRRTKAKTRPVGQRRPTIPASSAQGVTVLQDLIKIIAAAVTRSN